MKIRIVLVWLALLLIALVVVLVACIALALFVAYHIGGWWLTILIVLFILSMAAVNLFGDRIYDWATN